MLANLVALSFCYICHKLAARLTDSDWLCMSILRVCFVWHVDNSSSSRYDSTTSYVLLLN